MEKGDEMKRHYLFIIIVFALTWLLWLPAVLNSYIEVPNVLLIFSMFANAVPSVVGIVFLNKYYKGWFKSSFKIKVPFYIMAMILLYIPLQGIMTFFITRSFVPDLSIESSPLNVLMMFFMIMVIGGPLGEEFGWRGYLQREATKEHLLKGTLVIGLVWSLWHLPLFFMENTVQSQIPFYQFMLQNTLFAFYYTWFYERTKGSIFWMIMFHTVANVTSAIIPYWHSNLGRWIGFIILLLGYLVLPKKGERDVHKVG